MESPKPFIINLNKPAGVSSQDVIRRWKPRLRGMGKIGHFGTLDPFAQGVLMLGVGGAQRLNEYIHECLPKTYLAKGILGLETVTGDLTVDPSQQDDSEYLKEVISQFNIEFIHKRLSDKFLGDYWQSPHTYSAAKYEGKALHKWAREGVEIKKEKKLRHIYSLEVVKFEFPHLWVRFSVSSGTYIRSLFAECAKELGTLGVLDELIREKVGGCNLENALGDLSREETFSIMESSFLPIDQVLDFSSLYFSGKELHLYRNGVRLQAERASRVEKGSLSSPYYWARDESQIIYGLCQIVNGEIKSLVNFGL